MELGIAIFAGLMLVCVLSWFAARHDSRRRWEPDVDVGSVWSIPTSSGDSLRGRSDSGCGSGSDGGGGCGGGD